jgi:hypothetical protein
MAMSQQLQFSAPFGLGPANGHVFGPAPGLPEGKVIAGFGRYSGHNSPEELLAQMVGLGAFPEGTVINEGLVKTNGVVPCLGYDYRPWFLKNIQKKLIEGTLRTKGYLDSTAAIIHTTTDQEIIDTTRLECPLMELLPMETARGAVASYDVLTARGKGGFSIEVPTPPTVPSDTYVNATKALGIATMWGGWADFGLSAAASQYPTRDYRALEIRNKTWSLNEQWENETLNGSTALESAYNTGSGSFGSGAIAFIGLRGECISSSQTTVHLDKSNADITDADIDSIIAAGTLLNIKYNLIVTDLYTWQKVKQLMMSIVRYMNPETEIAWGLKALAWATPYGVAPIIASKFMPTTTGSREMLFLDTKFLAQRILLDSTMEMLAKTTLAQPFVIKKFGNLIDKTDSAPQTYNYNSNPTGTSGTSKMGRIYDIA